MGNYISSVTFGTIICDIVKEMSQRITHRRRHSFATKSNQRKLVRTPGGRFITQHKNSKPTLPVCPLTGQTLNGLPALRAAERSRRSHKNKTVNRAYGGVLSHQAVRERIVRAFLIEEEKIVRKVLKL